MKRVSFFLPEDIRDRLAAESRRSGVPVAELVRRSLDATTPPVTIGMGELRKFVDKQGQMTVFVLAARDGKLLVEPGAGFDGLFEPMAQIWVPANMVKFPAPLPNQIHETPEAFRLNKAAAPTEPEEPKS
jgi:hypothetical protein